MANVGPDTTEDEISGMNCPVCKFHDQRMVPLRNGISIWSLWNDRSVVVLCRMEPGSVEREKYVSTGTMMRCIIILLLLLLSCCGLLTTTYSTIKIVDGDLERIDGIVNAAFVDLGAANGDTALKKDRPYLIYRLNKQGKREAYIYYVTYKISRNGVAVKIENVISGSDPDRLEKVMEYLFEITNKIESMFAEAGIETTIETDSYREPIKACI